MMLLNDLSVKNSLPSNRVAIPASLRASDYDKPGYIMRCAFVVSLDPEISIAVTSHEKQDKHILQQAAHK